MTSQGINFYFVLGIIALLPIIWAVTTSVLRKMANMTKTIEVDSGRRLSSSTWGSGNVNGVGFKGALKVIRCNNGYILETSTLFGGGKMWLAQNEIHITETVPSTVLRPEQLKIECGNNKVTLYGDLVDEIIVR